MAKDQPEKPRPKITMHGNTQTGSGTAVKAPGQYEVDFKKNVQSGSGTFLDMSDEPKPPQNDENHPQGSWRDHFGGMATNVAAGLILAALLGAITLVWRWLF